MLAERKLRSTYVSIRLWLRIRITVACSNELPWRSELNTRKRSNMYVDPYEYANCDLQILRRCGTSVCSNMRLKKTDRNKGYNRRLHRFEVKGSKKSWLRLKANLYDATQFKRERMKSGSRGCRSCSIHLSLSSIDCTVHLVTSIVVHLATKTFAHS